MTRWDRLRPGIAVCALALATMLSAHAQTVNTAPTRITTAFATGSGPDVVTRIIAEKLQLRWKQPVIVEARPGASGAIAVNAVKTQPGTGNDLLVADVGTLSINPLVFKHLKYDPDKDLTPVALAYSTAFFVVVGANSPIKNIKDLLAAARASSTGLSYASNAVGGPVHLASARLAAALDVAMIHVPYKESSQMSAAIATGEVDWAFLSIATLAPMLQAGKVRLLAVADRVRSSAAPDVPTLEEAGGPKGLDALTWVAIMAPAGTSVAAVNEINRAVNEVLTHSEVREKLATFSFIPGNLTPQQLAELMRKDRARYGEAVKRAKVSLD